MHQARLSADSMVTDLRLSQAKLVRITGVRSSSCSAKRAIAVTLDVRQQRYSVDDTLPRIPAASNARSIKKHIDAQSNSFLRAARRLQTVNCLMATTLKAVGMTQLAAPNYRATRTFRYRSEPRDRRSGISTARTSALRDPAPREPAKCSLAGDGEVIRRIERASGRSAVTQALSGSPIQTGHPPSRACDCTRCSVPAIGSVMPVGSGAKQPERYSRHRIAENQNSSIHPIEAADSREARPKCSRCPCRLLAEMMTQLPCGESRALARDTPAVIDKLFDVGWIESQWTPTRSHLDRRQVRSAFAGGVLNNPGNAHAQFLRHIPCPDKLTYGPAVVPDNRQKASVVGPIQTLCVLLIHTDHLDMLPIYGRGKIISNERSGHSGGTPLRGADRCARNPPSRAGRGEKRNVGKCRRAISVPAMCR